MLDALRLEQIYTANEFFLSNNSDFDDLLCDLYCRYTEEEMEGGYTIISDKKGRGATRIKAIQELGRCRSDEEAARCAAKDGLKIITDLQFAKHHRAFYLDTPENRELLKSVILK